MIARTLALLGMTVVVLATLSLPTAAQPAKGKKYALLVGVSEYKHANLPSLKYPANDVEALADVLGGKTSDFTSVRVLTKSRGLKAPKRDRPIKAFIERELETLLAKKGKDDTVLIALSGHGVQLEVEDPDGKGPSKSYSYFCPADADFAKISYATGKAPGLILLDDLMKRLGDCGAGTRLVLIDACRNEVKADAATRNLDLQRLTLPIGVGALYSCKSGERAWETDKFKHGVFFHFIIDGLKGKAANEKGEVRWSRLAEYAAEQVSEQVPKIIGAGAKQTPHAASNLVGASPILAKVEPRKVTPPVLSEAEKQYRRGRDLLRGTNGVKINRVYAEAEFKKAAAKDHPLAIVALARCYGSILARNPNSALKKDEVATVGERAFKAGLEQRAADGDPDALVELGHLYRAGYPKPVASRKLCYETFKKAADLGSLEGKFMAGTCYAINALGVEQNPDKELRLVEEAARGGLASAQYNMARYHEGAQPRFKVAKNEKEAIKWYTLAAEQQYPDAMFELAVKYLYGQGVTADHKKAESLLLAASDQRQHWAPHTLGQLYRDGSDQGIKKNNREAVKYLRQAANQGVTGAYLDLGRMLATGTAAVRDEKEAIKWLEKAVSLGGDGAKEAKTLLEKLQKK